MGLTQMDDELEAARAGLVQAYAHMREAVLRAYELGYTVARISELTGLSLEIVVGVVREYSNGSVIDDQPRESARQRGNPRAWPGQYQPANVRHATPTREDCVNVENLDDIVGKLSGI